MIKTTFPSFRRPRLFVRGRETVNRPSRNGLWRAARGDRVARCCPAIRHVIAILALAKVGLVRVSQWHLTARRRAFLRAFEPHECGGAPPMQPDCAILANGTIRARLGRRAHRRPDIFRARRIPTTGAEVRARRR